MHLVFQIIQIYVTILFLLILDFQSTATAQGIMKTFIAEFALICCSQLKLCQSKVFNIKYDEFPSALILQHHPTQGDSCHWSTGVLGWEVLLRALFPCLPVQEIIIHFTLYEISPLTSILNSFLN